jgi:DNA-binding transcriptional ArsR family regulator
MSRARGPGPRSLEALEWLERVDVAGLEPLGAVLGVGWRTTYSHVERLAAAGLVVRIYDREGSVVAITRRGRRALGLEGGDVWLGATHGLGLAHGRALSWAAAFQTLVGRPVIADRHLRRDSRWQVPVIWPGSHGTHRPDLVVDAGGRWLAVEVELTPKAPRRLRAILDGYAIAIAARRLDVVSYLSDRPDVLRAVERAASHTDLPPRALDVRTLDDVRDRVRQRSVYRRPT